MQVSNDPHFGGLYESFKRADEWTHRNENQTQSKEITSIISWMTNAPSLFWVHAPVGQEQYFTNVLILIVCGVNELGPCLKPDQAPHFERNIRN